MTPDKRQRSPRGLIENVSEVREWVLGEQGGEELSSLFATLNAYNPINDPIRGWREVATECISASGKTPKDYRALSESQTLDPVCAAARILTQLDKIEYYIKLSEHPEMFTRGNPELSIRASLRAALQEALLLPIFVHQLTVVDNEPGLDAQQIHAENLCLARNNRTDKAGRNRAPIETQIQKLLEEDWEQKDTEIARAISEKVGHRYQFRTIREMVADVRKKLAPSLGSANSTTLLRSRRNPPRDENGFKSTKRPHYAGRSTR